ncbi:uncharacterized protein LOC142472428 [Ascaphus truei]|uniref:uncharacterized protein LOC142472428 n=1 Tax=Ascaphus truei TaxID=8439 RepID=UPI003F5A76FD
MYISFLLLQLQVTWCPSYANGGTTTTLTSRGWGNLMGQKGQLPQRLPKLRPGGHCNPLPPSVGARSWVLEEVAAKSQHRISTETSSPQATTGLLRKLEMQRNAFSRQSERPERTVIVTSFVLMAMSGPPTPDSLLRSCRCFVCLALIESPEGARGLSTGQETEGLQSSLRLQGQQVNVALCGNTLSWSSQRRAAGGTGGPTVSVPVSEIVTVQLGDLKHEQKSNEPRAAPSNRFTVYHVCRGSAPCWTLQIATFTAQDAREAHRWVQSLRDRIQESGGHRRPRNLLVFINPYGGRGKAARIYSTKICPLFQLAGIESKVIETTQANHARDYILRTDLKEYDGVVCVGGDGMFNELLHGLVGRTQRESGVREEEEEELTPCSLRIGIIPAGPRKERVTFTNVPREERVTFTNVPREERVTFTNIPSKERVTFTNVPRKERVTFTNVPREELFSKIETEAAKKTLSNLQKILEDYKAIKQENALLLGRVREA